MKKKKVIDHTPSSGNVFEDLGLPDAEAMLIKADLVCHLNETIKKKRLSPTLAAEKLKIPEEKIKLLAHGHLGKFSIEKLITYLDRVGQRVHVAVESKKNASVSQAKKKK